MNGTLKNKNNRKRPRVVAFFIGDERMKLLWDFDGTLFDTYPLYVETMLEVFPHLKETFERDEILKELQVSFTHGFQYLGLSAEQEALYRRTNVALDPKRFQPFEGVEQVLKEAEVNVIMSHKEKVVIEAVLREHNLLQYFAEITTPAQGFPRKPHAEAYEYLHAKYTLDAAIGDRALDLIPAKEVGMKTIMFRGTCAASDASLAHYKDFQKVWETL